MSNDNLEGPHPAWPGFTGMSHECYLHLASLAEGWLLELRPTPEVLGIASSWRQPRGDEARAIYVVVNGEGNCCYVGQTRPSNKSENVAALRLRQHLREPSKRENWSSYWVIPLRAETPDSFVNLLERRVALRLMVPLRHRAARRAPSRPRRPPRVIQQ